MSFDGHDDDEVLELVCRALSDTGSSLAANLVRDAITVADSYGADNRKLALVLICLAKRAANQSLLFSGRVAAFEGDLVGLQEQLQNLEAAARVQADCATGRRPASFLWLLVLFVFSFILGYFVNM